jgi:8-oxo-dGTP pyrophosphatase MutT (NUDIX family)
MSSTTWGAPDETIPAKPAATVMVVRNAEPDVSGRPGASEPGATDPGVEVFVLRRTSGAAFGAGMFVFPGGRVDVADDGPAIEPYVDGMDDAVASRQLGIETGGLAFWVAAIRECFEESGLLLAAARSGGPPAPEPADRVAVHRGELSMIELCRKHDLVLDAGALRYVAHWVTPVGETPRRFDTRFFLAAAPAGQHGVHDDAETVDSRWVRPADALRDAEQGELMMMPPTIANILFLDGCTDAAAALAKADAAGPPRRIHPKIRRDASGALVSFSMPVDPDYDSLL